MPIYAIGDLSPTIASSAFVHPDAVIIGNVTLGEKASVWPGAVLRGDHGLIRIGDSTSIQDGSIIHCSADFDTVIGSRCVVGHRVHIVGHGCSSQLEGRFSMLFLTGILRASNRLAAIQPPSTSKVWPVV